MFMLGAAASATYSRDTRHAECERWDRNVQRWSQAVADGTGELTLEETTALGLAQAGMIAARNQMCGY
jgi:hypothetical protein